MKRNYINAILACSLVVSLAACTDAWDEHYQVDPALNGGENAGKTLWELISEDEELEDFADLLRATKWDSLLMCNRSYTVWAPTDLEGVFDRSLLNDSSMLEVYKKEIVENHIADYSHVAGGIRDKEDKKNYKRIEMLNGKLCDFEGAVGKEYTFAGNSLKASNIVAKNGVLHKLDKYASFSANIWEQLAKETSVKEFYSFFAKDYKTVFDKANSVEGPIVDGKVTYLYSAYKDECRWFDKYSGSYIGSLNVEDSSYTVYAPTDAVWKELCDLERGYYNYPDVTTKDEGAGVRPIQEVADSVLKEDLAESLFVFSNTVNKKFYEGGRDTLRSTGYKLFIGDDAYALEQGCEKEVTLSNGKLHIINQLNYDPYKLWFDTLRVAGISLTSGNTERGEDMALRKYQNATTKIESIERGDSLYNKVLYNSVGVFTPTNNKKDVEQPIFRFYVNDILSACYKISIVLLPPHFVDPEDTVFIKPNKFTAKLEYPDGEGKMKFISLNDEYNDGKPFISDSSRVDTIVLAEKFKFDYCEASYKDLTGKDPITCLEIKTNIKFGQRGEYENHSADKSIRDPKKWMYDNSYRISQVMFEPVKE